MVTFPKYFSYFYSHTCCSRARTYINRDQAAGLSYCKTNELVCVGVYVPCMQAEGRPILWKVTTGQTNTHTYTHTRGISQYSQAANQTQFLMQCHSGTFQVPHRTGAVGGIVRYNSHFLLHHKNVTVFCSLQRKDTGLKTHTHTPHWYSHRRTCHMHTQTRPS